VFYIYIGVFDHEYFTKVDDLEGLCFSSALDQIYTYAVQPLEVGVDYLRFESNYLDRVLTNVPQPISEADDDETLPAEVLGSMKNWIKEAKLRWRRTHTGNGGAKTAMGALQRRRAKWAKKVKKLQSEQPMHEEMLDKLRVDQLVK